MVCEFSTCIESDTYIVPIMGDNVRRLCSKHIEISRWPPYCMYCYKSIVILKGSNKTSECFYRIEEPRGYKGRFFCYSCDYRVASIKNLKTMEWFWKKPLLTIKTPSKKLKLVKPKQPFQKILKSSFGHHGERHIDW